jgi:hypothetical protein
MSFFQMAASRIKGLEDSTDKLVLVSFIFLEISYTSVKRNPHVSLVRDLF